ncbi:hypothetical protein BX265_8361 [Streptomyces sp. TLI_235]|nr:hypothetical protein [Streptomyces sp. TLI_235]PBC66296.1 hypothetical protein BX265_8361 [Streptomyces sp. TLI_235]
MRKRVSRPPRFAAVDNKAIDTLPSILAIGLLTRLIRARDGEDVTVESLAKDYAEGEDSLGKAMRALVEAANVVKFKVQRLRSEDVEESDGTRTSKRGGSWWTTFSVDSIPFTAEDVAAIVGEIKSQGNVRQIRVEPARLDPDPSRRAPTTVRQTPTRAPKSPARPAPPMPGVGPTGAHAPAESETHLRPTLGLPGPGQPEPGRPTLGRAGAFFKGKTENQKTDNGPSVPPSVPGPGERASRTPEGGTDGGEARRRSAQEPGSAIVPISPPTSSAASDGVALLMEAARRDPRAGLAGTLLVELGLHVQGLLACGWEPELILAQILATRPVPDHIRTSDAAITAARIRAVPMTPPTLVAQLALVPRQAQRSAGNQPTPRKHHECRGHEGQCGRPVPVADELCGACRQPCANDCGRPANPSRTRDKLCIPCGSRRDESALPHCADCGGKPAVRRSGRCADCHRLHDEWNQAAIDAADAERAFAALLDAHSGGSGEGPAAACDL